MLPETNKPIDAYIDLKAVKKMYNISYVYLYYIKYIQNTLGARLKNSIYVLKKKIH